VERLDAIVRSAFRGDRAVLAAWRGAKRVHLLPGGTGARVTDMRVTEAAAAAMTAEEGVLLRAA